MRRYKKKFWKLFSNNKVISTFSQPVVILSSRGVIVKTNQVMLDLLLFNPVGMNLSDLFQKISLETAGQVDKLVTGEIFSNTVYRLEDKNGAVKFFSCSKPPVHQGDSVDDLILVWHDITTIINTQLQLRKSNRELIALVNSLSKKQKSLDKQMLVYREELRTKKSQLMISNKLLEIIFSNTHFLIAYLTPDFYFIQVNDAYAKAFNQKPIFFENKNYFDLFSHEEIKTIFENVVKTGESYITYADQFPQHNQSIPAISYWDWSLQAMKNKNKVEGVILVQIDVTRRKKAEEDLLSAKRLSGLGTLAATVAHELRNPLGVIQAAIYNIKKKRRNSDIDGHIENIEIVIEESEQIINNLLSYSQVKIPIRNEIPIYSFLNELFCDIRSKNVKPEVNLITKYEELRGEIAFIDSFQIREVLNNIINNAYQALFQKGGQIEIQGRLIKNNQFVLSIKDNGDGIDDENLAKIFDPFFTCRSRGTGLGLTICKELVKLHNGRIEVHSLKGQGTCFNIFLPLKEM